jgi:hypothetical protein
MELSHSLLFSEANNIECYLKANFNINYNKESIRKCVNLIVL